MRKHIPHKFTDVNIIRSILLNINEHIDTDYNDYKISDTRYIAIIKSLIQFGIVSHTENNTSYNTSELIIANIDLFNKWSKRGFYSTIEKFIIPILLESIKLLQF